MEFSSVECIIGAAADLGVGAPDPDRSVRGSVWPHLPMNTQDSVCGIRDRSGSENERGAVERPTSLYSIPPPPHLRTEVVGNQPGKGSVEVASVRVCGWAEVSKRFNGTT